MSEIPFPEQQEPNLDPEVVAHSDGEEGEEDPCGSMQVDCGWNWS